MLWRMPSPSAPSTSATGPAGSASASVALGLAGQADPPVTRLGHFLERAGQVDHPHPRHDLERARSRILATTPDSGGAWRSCVTIAAAPNAAAERRIAPTLCGSVTWSSTTTGAAARRRAPRRGRRRRAGRIRAPAPGAAHRARPAARGRRRRPIRPGNRRAARRRARRRLRGSPTACGGCARGS